ncbi:MAG: hypothetical protein JO269_11625 [Burkholderiaceae bacterium]|nr:hypothetical protein [Burkholderiaceae bacterium]
MTISEATTSNRPLYIIMHGNNIVAIVANDNGLPAGTVFPDGRPNKKARDPRAFLLSKPPGS